MSAPVAVRVAFTPAGGWWLVIVERPGAALALDSRHGTRADAVAAAERLGRPLDRCRASASARRSGLVSAATSRFWWAERICWTISIAVMAGAALFLLVAVYPPGGPPVVTTCGVELPCPEGGPKVDTQRPLPDWITDQYQRAHQTAGTAS